MLRLATVRLPENYGKSAPGGIIRRRATAATMSEEVRLYAPLWRLEGLCEARYGPGVLVFCGI